MVVFVSKLERILYIHAVLSGSFQQNVGPCELAAKLDVTDANMHK